MIRFNLFCIGTTRCDLVYPEVKKCYVILNGFCFCFFKLCVRETLCDMYIVCQEFLYLVVLYKHHCLPREADNDNYYFYWFISVT